MLRIICSRKPFTTGDWSCATIREGCVQCVFILKCVSDTCHHNLNIFITICFHTIYFNHVSPPTTSLSSYPSLPTQSSFFLSLKTHKSTHTNKNKQKITHTPQKQNRRKQTKKPTENQNKRTVELFVVL